MTSLVDVLDAYRRSSARGGSLAAGDGDGAGSGDGSGFGDGSGGDVSAHGETIAAGLFLMLFARFETELNERCRVLLLHMQAAPRWQDRRAWDLFDASRVADIPLRRRLALLLDRGRPPYADVSNLYRERNDLAHGLKTTLTFDFENAAVILQDALSAMERPS